MGRINNIWYYLSRHKYLITVVIGAVLVGVVDENSVRSLVMLSMRLNEKNEELQAYEEQFERDSIRLHNFEASLKGVETIARERYKMKRADEDVFVLSTEKNIGRENYE
ncbi:MAG: septum formation initiator family protein [Prevotella sp.]|nr:septum formation initiator family protein [Prevotella sp.]MBR6190708.1 septum formation initiator family protein [Prevotella sp.]